MSLIHTLTILICLAALFSYVNHRLLGGVVDREPRSLWVLVRDSNCSAWCESLAHAPDLNPDLGGASAAGFLWHCLCRCRWADAGGGGHHHLCGGGLLDPCLGAHDQPGVGIRREHQERG